MTYSKALQHWQEAVLRNAGFDPRVNPVTGEQTVVFVNGHWTGDYHLRQIKDSLSYRPANERVEIILDSRKDWLIRYPQSVAGEPRIAIFRDEEDLPLAVWTGDQEWSSAYWFFTNYHAPTADTPEDEYPPIPENLRVDWPEYWPKERLQWFDAEMARQMEWMRQEITLQKKFALAHYQINLKAHFFAWYWRPLRALIFKIIDETVQPS